MVNYETLMTIEDLSTYLKVTKRTIYEWLKLRKVPAVKLVGQWRFRKYKIDEWIEKQERTRWVNAG
jgi:excisionase family DNA binding protein